MENQVMIAIAQQTKQDGKKIILTGKDLEEIAQLAVFNKSVVRQAWHVQAKELFHAMKQLEENGLATSDLRVKQES